MRLYGTAGYEDAYLVSLVGSSRGNLALFAGGKLSEVAVVVTLPAKLLVRVIAQPGCEGYLHLVVEDLGLSRLGLWNQGLVKNVEDILADLLELGFNLLAVIADGGNVLLGSLGLLLLLDGGDDAPGSTAGSDDILVGDREQVALVNRELTTVLF